MNVNINQSAFEQIEKGQNGKLSPQQKEYLQNLVTGIKNDRTSYLPPSIEDGFGMPETKGNSMSAYLVNVTRFKTVFNVGKILDSVKGVNTETEIKTKFNKPEDVALLQAYLVLSGNLKTEKGVKEIDGAAGPKTLSAVQDYRKKETPRQEQVQKQQNQRQEIIKRQESIDDTNYVNEVVRDLKKQYKNGVDVSKNPVITITMAGNLTKKIYDTYTCTVSEFNQLQKVLVTFNLHDYTKVINSKNIFDKKLGGRNFDNDIDKQFNNQLKIKQDEQNVENNKADQKRADFLAEIEKSTNKNQALEIIRGKSFSVTKEFLSRTTLPQELKDYNRIYSDKITEEALNKAFLSKFDGGTSEKSIINLRNVRFDDNNLVIGLKSKQNESYMKNIKIATNKILDSDNNLDDDRLSASIFNHIRNTYISYIKEYVKLEEKAQIKKLNSV